ncbi:hypothetical protein OEA41_000016 [Lepraria neglecta]|uniref:Uncharacterized protein n=1 Tax=Lepraria neglecta TaxID=209136 RepID=A0AAD9ZF05_9LECA|nr:hypothetical protein OEA41_000016 [Lepraria neglecta]
MGPAAEPRKLRQIAQRDRIPESPQVFDGPDLTPIRSPSVDRYSYGHRPGEEEEDSKPEEDREEEEDNKGDKKWEEEEDNKGEEEGEEE